MSNGQEKNEFLSSVSHEVRTLLNTIVGLSQDIGEYENIPEEIREDAEDLVSASKELLELVGNILDFSKIRSSEMAIVNAPYNPRELFEELAKIDEKDIGDKPVSFHSNIDSRLPFELIGDKKHMEEVVNNLLTNAIKYTDGGDIWFDVKCINDSVNCTLTITVKDTGRGMKPEEIEKLFTQIERLNIERDTSREGTGLGLAITKSLIDMMGGAIKVESVYGEGSTFIFSVVQKIHMLEESDLSRTQRLKLQELNYAKEGYGYKKILIVDDNRLNIKVARRALEDFDLMIDECYNGKECIDVISKDTDYDVILMDIMMPGLSGEDTLKGLKEIEGFDIPVIALTADAEEGAQEKYRGMGFVDYIAKPFSKLQIERKLDKVFSQKDVVERTNNLNNGHKVVNSYDDDMWDE